MLYEVITVVLVQANDLRPVIAGVVKGPGFDPEYVAETTHYLVRTADGVPEPRNRRVEVNVR